MVYQVSILEFLILINILVCVLIIFQKKLLKYTYYLFLWLNTSVYQISLIYLYFGFFFEKNYHLISILINQTILEKIIFFSFYSIVCQQIMMFFLKKQKTPVFLINIFLIKLFLLFNSIYIYLIVVGSTSILLSCVVIIFSICVPCFFLRKKFIYYYSFFWSVSLSLLIFHLYVFNII